MYFIYVYYLHLGMNKKRKSPAGRKTVSDKKVMFYVYIEGSKAKAFIAKCGGEDAAKQDVINYITNKPNNNN